MSDGSVSSVAYKILNYLEHHPSAMDSVEGIAQWWVKCDPCLVQAALEDLAKVGMVAKQPCISCTFYCSIRREGQEGYK